MATNFYSQISENSNVYAAFEDEFGFITDAVLRDTSTLPTQRVFASGAQLWVEDTSTLYINSAVAGAAPNFEAVPVAGGATGVDSFNGRVGVVVPESGDYTAADVGLGNVDNTSDADKPISDDTQAALDDKVDIGTDIPVANGGTGLNSITEGDLIVGTGPDATGVINIGTAGQVLTSDGTTASWENAPESGNLFTADLTQSADRTHDQNSFNQTINEAGTWLLDTATGSVTLSPSTGQVELADATFTAQYGPGSFNLSDGTSGMAEYLAVTELDPWLEYNRRGENSYKFFTSNGTPEGVIVAPISSLCVDTETPSLYQKTADDGGDTGWVEIGSSVATGTANTVPFYDASGVFTTDDEFLLQPNSGGGVQPWRLNINNPSGWGEGDSYSAFTVLCGDGTTAQAIINMGDQAFTMATVGYNSVYQLYRSGGTFASKTNLTNGNVIGNFNWRGQANSGSRLLSGVSSTYQGNGTTTLSSLSWFVSGGTTGFNIDSSGNGSVPIALSVGHTAAPSAALHTIKTTLQNRTGYDSSNYIDLLVSSTGNVTQTLVGTNPSFNWQAAGSGTYNFLGTSTQAATIRLYEDTDDGSNYTAFKVGTQSGNITYTLPTADGSSGYVLSTNGSGVLSWASTGSGSSAITVIPQPVTPLDVTSSATFTTAVSGAPTVAILGQVIIPQAITVNKVTICLGGTDSDNSKLALYSQDGQTKYFDETFDSTSSTQVTNTLGAPLSLSAGIYYVAYTCQDALGGPGIYAWETSFVSSAGTEPFTIYAGVSSETVTSGTLAISSFTMPATFDPASLTGGTLCTPLFRLDN